MISKVIQLIVLLVYSRSIKHEEDNMPRTSKQTVISVCIENNIDISKVPDTILNHIVEGLYQAIYERVVKRDKRRRYYTPVKERQKNT